MSNDHIHQDATYQRNLSNKLDVTYEINELIHRTLIKMNCPAFFFLQSSIAAILLLLLLLYEN
uniref:Uncharacterized protein n=1 Tax=Glossina palpalis gambiensis TaxID=67801 RepID=A0A1B0BWJ1_9MUSC